MNDDLFEEEDSTEVISFEDDDGNRTDFAVLDNITGRGHTWAILCELTEDEEDDGADDEDEDDEDDSVLIYRIETDEDGSVSYEFEEDDDLADWAFTVYCISAEEYETGDAE